MQKDSFCSKYLLSMLLFKQDHAPQLTVYIRTCFVQNIWFLLLVI